eukprot:761456-Hanusia_phi.AAC.2
MSVPLRPVHRSEALGSTSEQICSMLCQHPHSVCVSAHGGMVERSKVRPRSQLQARVMLRQADATGQSRYVTQ